MSAPIRSDGDVARPIPGCHRSIPPLIFASTENCQVHRGYATSRRRHDGRRDVASAFAAAIEAVASVSGSGRLGDGSFRPGPWNSAPATARQSWLSEAECSASKLLSDKLSSFGDGFPHGGPANTDQVLHAAAQALTEWRVDSSGGEFCLRACAGGSGTGTLDWYATESSACTTPESSSYLKQTHGFRNEMAKDGERFAPTAEVLSTSFPPCSVPQSTSSWVQRTTRESQDAEDCEVTTTDSCQSDVADLAMQVSKLTTRLQYMEKQVQPTLRKLSQVLGELATPVQGCADIKDGSNTNAVEMVREPGLKRVLETSAGVGIAGVTHEQMHHFQGQTVPGDDSDGEELDVGVSPVIATLQPSFPIKLLSERGNGYFLPL